MGGKGIRKERPMKMRNVQLKFIVLFSSGIMNLWQIRGAPQFINATVHRRTAATSSVWVHSRWEMDESLCIISRCDTGAGTKSNHLSWAYFPHNTISLSLLLHCLISSKAPITKHKYSNVSGSRFSRIIIRNSLFWMLGGLQPALKHPFILRDAQLNASSVQQPAIWPEIYHNQDKILAVDI